MNFMYFRNVVRQILTFLSCERVGWDIDKRYPIKNEMCDFLGTAKVWESDLG